MVPEVVGGGDCDWVVDVWLDVDLGGKEDELREVEVEEELGGAGTWDTYGVA